MGIDTPALCHMKLYTEEEWSRAFDCICSVCQTEWSHPALFPVNVDKGKVSPVCYDCLVASKEALDAYHAELKNIDAAMV